MVARAQEGWEAGSVGGALGEGVGVHAVTRCRSSARCHHWGTVPWGCVSRLHVNLQSASKKEGKNPQPGPSLPASPHACAVLQALCPR